MSDGERPQPQAVRLGTLVLVPKRLRKNEILPNSFLLLQNQTKKLKIPRTLSVDLNLSPGLRIIKVRKK